jgi:hypothetical protein
VSDPQGDSARMWKEAIVIWVACLFLTSLCMWLADRRLDAAESRILDLENKPCLMTGAHTGCKR